MDLAVAPGPSTQNRKALVAVTWGQAQWSDSMTVVVAAAVEASVSCKAAESSPCQSASNAQRGLECTQD